MKSQVSIVKKNNWLHVVIMHTLGTLIPPVGFAGVCYWAYEYIEASHARVQGATVAGIWLLALIAFGIFLMWTGKTVVRVTKAMWATYSPRLPKWLRPGGRYDRQPATS